MYILSNISVSIQENEFVGIMWPSGVGKSTFLDLLAWLLIPDSWTIMFRWRPVSDSKHDLDLHTRNNVWIIFQNYGLFPWLTVKWHIDFGLLNTKKSTAEKDFIATDVLQKIWLSSYKEYYPHQLSWGMQQRLAVGSILANDSPCLLMDEPFSAVDIVTIHNMQSFLLEVHHKFKKTIIFVTHQIDEALLLSNRILLFGWVPWKITHEIVIEDTYPRNLHNQKYITYRKDIHDYLQLQELTF